MPNQHGPDREPIGAMFPRPLAVKIKKLASKKKMHLSELLMELAGQAAAHVPLTAEDFMSIAEATKRAERTRKRVSTPMAG